MNRLLVFGSPSVSVRVNSTGFVLQAERVRQDLPGPPSTVVVRGGDPQRHPLLDGRQMIAVDRDPPVFVGETRIGTADSYHEVHAFVPARLKPVTFGFCTERATRRADLTRRMIEYVSGVGQLPEQLFLLGALGDERRRSPGVVAGWMTDRLPDVAETLAEIARRPAVVEERAKAVRAWAKRPQIAAMRRLIRQRPEVLEEREAGALRIAGRRYTPILTVDQRGTRSYDLPENRQAAAFAEVLSREVAVLARGGLLGSYAGPVSQWSIAANAAACLLRRRGVESDPASLRCQATALQRRDPRYVRLFELLTEYRRLRSFEPADDELRTLIEAAPRLYQAFLAYAVADAFELRPTGPLLTNRSKGASFTGPGQRLYYDVKPPPEVIPSWRDGSRHPDAYRPDITVVDEVRGVLLIDAKFKDYRADADLAADLMEMQAYHDSFGVSRSVIATPFGRGPQDNVDVAGGHHLIRVALIPPVTPANVEELRRYLRRQLEPMFVSPRPGDYYHKSG